MTRLEVALSIWGIVGPLLTAAVGAIWVRRNAVNDREYAAAQRAADLSREAREHAERHRIETAETRYIQIKDAMVAFYSSADMYLAALDAGGSQPKDGEFTLIAEHAAALTHAQALLELVTNDDVTRAAREWRNACLDLGAASEMSVTEREKLEKQFGVKQDAFVNAARQYLMIAAPV